MKKALALIGGSLAVLFAAYLAIAALYPHCAQGHGVHYTSATSAAKAFTSHLQDGNEPPTCLCFAKDEETERLRSEVAATGADTTGLYKSDQGGSIHEFRFTDPRLSRYELHVSSTSYRAWYMPMPALFYTAGLVETIE